MQGSASKEEYCVLISKLDEHVKYPPIPRGGDRGDLASFPSLSTSNLLAHTPYKEACTASKPSVGFTSHALYNTLHRTNDVMQIIKHKIMVGS